MSEVGEVGVEELAEILEKHDEFLAKHYNELIEKYPGKVVAIEDSQVIAVGDNHIEVYRSCRKEGQRVAPMVLDIPHPDDMMPFII